MNLQDTEIAQIVTTICQALLEIDCVQTTDFAEESPDHAPEHSPEHSPSQSTAHSHDVMSACVHITGGWQGAIVLSCSEAFAALAAAVMFKTVPDDRRITDMQDAIAELANMIGGNVKGLITEECQLSLPGVVTDADSAARLDGSQLIHCLAFNCVGHVIVVTVLEKLPAASAA